MLYQKDRAHWGYLNFSITCISPRTPPSLQGHLRFFSLSTEQREILILLHVSMGGTNMYFRLIIKGHVLCHNSSNLRIHVSLLFHKLRERERENRSLTSVLFRLDNLTLQMKQKRSTSLRNVMQIYPNSVLVKCISPESSSTQAKNDYPEKAPAWATPVFLTCSIVERYFYPGKYHKAGIYETMDRIHMEKLRVSTHWYKCHVLANTIDHCCNCSRNCPMYSGTCTLGIDKLSFLRTHPHLRIWQRQT